MIKVLILKQFKNKGCPLLLQCKLQLSCNFMRTSSFAAYQLVITSAYYKHRHKYTLH